MIIRNLVLFAAAYLVAGYSSGSDEIQPAVLTSKSQDGFLQTAKGIEPIRFNVVDGVALIEGDIVIGKVGPDENRKSLIIRAPQRLWPDRIVAYAVNPEMRNQADVQGALNHWRTKTKLTFIERNASNADRYPNYIYFTNTNNQVCSSPVGMIGGMQPIELADACGLGAAIHEIGHAVGLAHEHMRSDRDQYVKVYLENVEPSMQHNFTIKPEIYADSGPYDFASIMHYDSTAFSINGRATIVPLSGQPIGQRSGLSTEDLASISRLYPERQENKVCVTLAILNQPFVTGIGDIDVQLKVGATKVVDAVIPYRSNYGHFGFEKFKFWAPKGTHSFLISSSRGQASLGGTLPVTNNTTALEVQFWGQRNGQPLRYFTSTVLPYYDDIEDEAECTPRSPTVGYLQANTVEAVGQRGLSFADKRVANREWPISDTSVFVADRLDIPAYTTHKVPLGVTEYKIGELKIGDGATISFPNDLNRFTFSAQRSTIGEKVRFDADGSPGETGANAPHTGAAGFDGGPGGNAPTFILSLGEATVGKKLRIYLRGGIGGNGGTGGNGRTGFDAQCVPPIDAKNGGPGGPGGYAGPGGAGGFLYLRGVVSSPLDSFVAFIEGGESDYVGGTGGQGGRGGRGARCGVFTMGAGRNGSNGASRSTDAAGRVRGPEGRIFDEIIVRSR